MWSSNQTAGVIAAQQASFHNQGVAAASISYGMGFAKTPPPQAMGNPYGGAYSVAGGAMAMLPAAAGLAHTGGMVAGMLAPAGSAMSMLDPFSNAFRAGSAAGGWGARGIAAGLGAGALTMAPYAAASYGASQLFQGATQAAGVGRSLDQNFSFGNASAPTGRGFDVQQVVQITRSMRDVARQASVGMNEIQQVMESFSSMGLMQSVRNAEQFSSKMRELVGATRTVSKILGTTLEESASVVGASRLSGMYTAQDITGGAVRRGVLGSVGYSDTQITGLQSTGAQIAAGVGARRGTGARLATRLGADIAVANKMGIVSNEDLIEAYGAEGPQAHAMMAQRMTQATMAFTQTQAGQLMMMAAGEKKDGKYTGQVTSGKLRQAMQLGPSELRRVGAAAGSGRDAKLSFVANRHELAGNLAEQGGPEMIGAMVRNIIGERFDYMDEGDATTILMEKMVGLERREAQMFTEMAREMPRVAAERRREFQQEIERVVAEEERKRFRTMGGSWRRNVGEPWQRRVSNPLQQTGSEMWGGIVQAGVDVRDRWYGTERPVASQQYMLDRAYGQASAVPLSGDVTVEAGERSPISRKLFWGSKFQSGANTPAWSSLPLLNQVEQGVVTGQFPGEIFADRGEWSGDKARAGADIIGLLGPRGNIQDEDAARTIVKRLLRDPSISREATEAIRSATGATREDLRWRHLTDPQRGQAMARTVEMVRAAGFDRFMGNSPVGSQADLQTAARRQREALDTLLNTDIQRGDMVNTGMGTLRERTALRGKVNLRSIESSPTKLPLMLSMMAPQGDGIDEARSGYAALKRDLDSYRWFKAEGKPIPPHLKRFEEAGISAPEAEELSGLMGNLSEVSEEGLADLRTRVSSAASATAMVGSAQYEASVAVQGRGMRAVYRKMKQDKSFTGTDDIFSKLGKFVGAREKGKAGREEAGALFSELSSLGDKRAEAHIMSQIEGMGAGGEDLVRRWELWKDSEGRGKVGSLEELYRYAEGKGIGRPEAGSKAAKEWEKYFSAESESGEKLSAAESQAIWASLDEAIAGSPALASTSATRTAGGAHVRSQQLALAASMAELATKMGELEAIHVDYVNRMEAKERDGEAGQN